jgi:hypothetical protein
MDGESHQEQSGIKSRVSAIVTLSCLDCCWCHLLVDDSCNPGHRYIRWHKEP